MAAAWVRWRAAGAPGILWMDPDIVADPHDLDAMHAAIGANPADVSCSWHKLWPASTGRDEWVWGFGPWIADRPVMTQNTRGPVEWFALGFTYTPGRLLDEIWQDLDVWEFGQIDMGLSRAARELEIPIRAAVGCRPKHVHFTKRPGDVGYRP